MRLVQYPDIDLNDLVCLPKPPYRPMIVVWIGGAPDVRVTLAEYPARANSPRVVLTPDAFNARGYVSYEEDRDHVDDHA